MGLPSDQSGLLRVAEYELEPHNVVRTPSVGVLPISIMRP